MASLITSRTVLVHLLYSVNTPSNHPAPCLNIPWSWQQYAGQTTGGTSENHLACLHQLLYWVSKWLFLFAPWDPEFFCWGQNKCVVGDLTPFIGFCLFIMFLKSWLVKILNNNRQIRSIFFSSHNALKNSVPWTEVVKVPWGRRTLQVATKRLNVLSRIGVGFVHSGLL